MNQSVDTHRHIDTSLNHSGERSVELSPKLEALFQHIDQQRDQIDRLKQEKPELWTSVLRKVQYSWTYNSNAIEGSTLSLGDTIFFLQEGLTVEGKPFKDFLDAKNHQQAIEFLFDVVTNRREITEGLMKEINALLLAGTDSTPAINEHGQAIEKPANPGEYKKLPNHVLQADGTIHHYVDPIHVQAAMEQLCNWVTERVDLHPLIQAATAHHEMVRIHPFDDGNGRGARILMNLILMQKNYLPVVIQQAQRRAYLTVLKQVDEGNLQPFIQFIAESAALTYEQMLEDLS